MTKLWRNLSSIRRQTQKTDVNLFFTMTRPQNGQMSRINEGKRRCKLAVNKDKWILFKMTRTLSIAFLAFWLLLKKVHKILLFKKLTVWQLKIKLESLHKLKFYLSVLLLMIKMSQSAHKKLNSYCKIYNWIAHWELV